MRARVAAELLRLGADVNAVDNIGVAALMYAVLSGDVGVIRVLLAVPGVDVNLTTVDGRTALSWARGKRHAAVVALLEAAGAR